MTEKRKINVAKALASQLKVTEEAIDTALIEAANLVEACVSSRRAIRLSTTVGNDVHYNTLQAMLALNAAQRHMTAAHEGLALIRDQVGLTGCVPGDDKPPPRPAAGPIDVRTGTS